MKRNRKIALIPIIITAIAGVILYYLALPALSFKSAGFWWYVIILLSLFEALLIIAGISGFDNNKTIVTAGGFALGLSLLIFVIMSFASSRLFNSSDYANLMRDNIREVDFSTYQATLGNVPLLDRDSAIQISNRELGSLIDVVSQFELGQNVQITLKGKSVRVSPLYYGSFFKWNNNKNAGTPGYIKVDMMTQEAELVRLEEGIKYSPSEFFGRDLKRYLRIRYPSAVFNCYNFEIDESGNPFWIVAVEKHTIGLFGGVDIDYVLLVNAVTGEISKYSIKEIPDWVDNVYSSDLIISQYDDYGSLQNGYWNSVLGQKGVKVTTDGYNYIPQSNDSWIYTGVTSAGRDESNIGFILSNKRTKETIYYPISGAEEYSAMSSAEGMVQHLGYKATFPLLLKIEGQPTYMMALKDDGGLVKMYGMVNVQKYQIVATGDTIQSTQQKYRELLKNNSMDVSETETERITGIIEAIKTAAIDGTTYYYIKLRSYDDYFMLNIKDNQLAVLKEVGDTIALDVDKVNTGKIKNALMIE
ncbi:hypothetical protein OXPF_25130 [Oxobacter pfennigii]|uniref:CvpA family protein n=1 Tax=Oxobacter pfennigii TaxID=36849 RepID=A0A0P8YX98_9CLOT|nr:hypothetical protein [Oxobacter pfennigii]KPU44343.1 hypothetical protein OXPF_25130 [Oxobacter pfennigii]